MNATNTDYVTEEEFKASFTAADIELERCALMCELEVVRLNAAGMIADNLVRTSAELIPYTSADFGREADTALDIARQLREFQKGTL